MLTFNPDRVVAFPGQVGTSNMIALARERGVPITCAVEGG